MRSRTIASRQTEYRAAAGSSSLAQAKFHQSDHTAQLKTAIKHFTGTLDVLDEKRTVGKEVQASLDPKDPVVGSATGVNTDWMKSIRKSYPKANVVRGHLLNHDLGGFAVEENLYPISTKANSDHSTKVEQKVKAALTSADKGGGMVNYQVKVKENFGYENAQFDCAWVEFDSKRNPVSKGKESIVSDLGKHVGGFGGWGKTAKSPVAWRHGKSKGGTEVADVKKRLDLAVKHGKVTFSTEHKDYGGKGAGDGQDYIEQLNDLAEEYGAKFVWERIKQLLESEKDESTISLYVKWMNLLSQREDMIIKV